VLAPFLFSYGAVVITIGELQVNVIDWVPMLETSPEMSVVLFTKTVVLYKGLVDETTALVCFSVRGTVVPQADCKAVRTEPAPDAESSFRKSRVIVLASRPLTNLCAVSILLLPLLAG
jgi:hypothetical protein